MNYNFEWDPNKAKTNLSKHKINFEDAVSIFKDKNAISIYDDKHSIHEDRWVTIGLDDKTRMLVVIHSFVIIDKNDCNVRIISARKATKLENKVYQQG
ncbi:BrnT family toxin [Candidatus Thioglobus autotrophicus]|uniref:BrnT family toxin n=1 Tax=Candidatus Thioglobus autotrophicus TaxID=1705394 RepID=UPI00299D9FCC|nr:BrnT family toxin [Candidatus Thioglobus autotrophicus]WPE18423.1 BrnT family toxin [Candidatus Thioglobus autotrophicus]